jgi:ferredoxin
MKYHVNGDCIGCGLCASVCPEVFHMTGDNLSEASGEAVAPAYETAAREAQESCPVSAIEEEN